ncbi:bifunctional 5,10-methylenetetrahydrofolate dehydrogenase/5,10-methenyltetrahydrofolate cyclohydrolase [Urinicoccus massiliensis]|uniref:bifunctional 5,10-methylenetetrahydrofolate dehydrogenase/5,10-methenyltetrahydrofolate cyclohydrolase n=1 Tax=Urinicoccus massiliensis TaxID=1723382 RepID=UPI00093002DB|nr:bifunctional 5,10-methylenetetrahydrofolate dehydrogenase/5,10-methenyltetrahydrofolate cyclohydrolase [Urinicoccus massiliensis]
MELRSDQIKKDLLDKIKKQIEEGTLDGTKECCIFRFGEDSGAKSYERGLVKTAQSLGIKLRTHHYDQMTDQILEDFARENKDDQVGGILLLEPIFKEVEDQLKRDLDPKKDLDGVTLYNRGALYSGLTPYHIPATPRAALMLCKSYWQDLSGKEVVVINRTTVVGKPLLHLLLKENATVTLCHSKTKNLKDHLKRADIVFTATGRAHSIHSEDVGDHALVIDIGLGMKDGKLVGDVDYQGFKDSQVVTPVPGGVGALTNTLLLESCLKKHRD